MTDSKFVTVKLEREWLPCIRSERGRSLLCRITPCFAVTSEARNPARKREQQHVVINFSIEL